MLWSGPGISAPIFPSPTIRYFIRYRTNLSRSAARSTGYANGADSGSCGSNEFQVLELEVAHEDRLADAQRGHVYDQFVGQVLDQRADDQLAGRQSQLTADLHTLGVTRQAYRNRDRNGLAVGDTVEVEVQDLLADGWN